MFAPAQAGLRTHAVLWQLLVCELLALLTWRTWEGEDRDACACGPSPLPCGGGGKRSGPSCVRARRHTGHQHTHAWPGTAQPPGVAAAGPLSAWRTSGRPRASMQAQSQHHHQHHRHDLKAALRSSCSCRAGGGGSALTSRGARAQLEQWHACAALPSTSSSAPHRNATTATANGAVEPWGSSSRRVGRLVGRTSQQQRRPAARASAAVGDAAGAYAMGHAVRGPGGIATTAITLARSPGAASVDGYGITQWHQRDA